MVSVGPVSAEGGSGGLDRGAAVEMGLPSRASMAAATLDGSGGWLADVVGELLLQELPHFGAKGGFFG